MRTKEEALEDLILVIEGPDGQTQAGEQAWEYSSVERIAKAYAIECLEDYRERVKATLLKSSIHSEAIGFTLNLLDSTPLQK